MDFAAMHVAERPIVKTCIDELVYLAGCVVIVSLSPSQSRMEQRDVNCATYRRFELWQEYLERAD